MGENMENQKIESGRERKEYDFGRLPENVRQIGEQTEKHRIYIEDYVMTYIHQVFQKKQEQAVVILLGKRGEKEAEECSFIYGAVEAAVDLSAGEKEFNQDTWEKIQELVYQNFAGADVMGWGCGVSIWNSRIDEVVRAIQKKHFAQEGKVLFVEDLNEREEKVFCWRDGKLQEQEGYFVYYEKNPLMQEYMLLGQPKESLDTAYDDSVTAAVRAVIQKKEELKSPNRIAVYSVGVLLALLTILGANLLLQSTKKIDALEKTITTLSNTAVNVTAVPDGETSTKEAVRKADIEKEDTDGKDTAKTAKKEEKAQNTGKPKDTEKPQNTGKPKGTEKPKNTKKPQETEKPKDTESPQETEKPKTAEKPKTIVKAESTEKPKKQESAAVSDKQENTVKSTAQPGKKKSESSDTPVSLAAASYVVCSGDTLSQIVWRQYHTLACMEMVKEANHIEDGDKIQEGQRILLPAYRK
jgi:phage tail protein X